MPAKPPLSETPQTVAASAPTAERADQDLTAPGWQPAADPGTPPADPGTPPADPGTPPADGSLSPADRVAAERTERRRQRAAAHKAAPAAEPQRARPRGRATRAIESRSARTPPRRTVFRDSSSITLIAMLAAGAVLGAILGALSAPGWVIGLLAAGLTVVLAVAIRRYSPST
jgi:hypothetical protein